MNVPAGDIFDCPKIEGTHSDDKDVAKSFIVVEDSKKHVKHQCKTLEKQVEEAHCWVSRVLNELR